MPRVGQRFGVGLVAPPFHCFLTESGPCRYEQEEAFEVRVYTLVELESVRHMDQGTRALSLEKHREHSHLPGL
jgi:hypothetical protein